MAFICIDGSEHSERAFNFYLESVHKKADDVNLVHIHIPPDFPASGLYGDSLGAMQLYAELLRSSMNESKSIIHKYRDLCKHKGIACNTFIESINDSVGHTICEIAKSNNAKLIVMGQRGLGVIRRTLFGSVSDYVLHHVHVPVIVVPPSER